MANVDDLRPRRALGNGITQNLLRRRLDPLLGYLGRERDTYAATEAACREDAVHGAIADAMPTVGPTGWVLLWGP